MPPRTPGATPPLLRNLNERTVLEAIRAGAPISRAQISRRSGISKPTVSLALQSLLEAGLVREASEPPDGPGYGALYFEPVADAALVLGLDLGARFVRGAVCDLAGTVRARQDVELSVAAGSNYIGDFVMALVIWKIVQPSFSDQLTPLGPDYHWMIGAASALSWLCVVALVLVCFWYANFRARHRFPPEGRR